MYREVIGIIPFLNDGITLTKNGFVVAQFIAPLGHNIKCALRCHKYSVMVFYLSELVLQSAAVNLPAVAFEIGPERLHPDLH